MAEGMNDMQTTDYPEIFRRYVEETDPDPTTMPRRVKRRFHGREIPIWFGYVHVDDVEGYAENLRLRFYLKQWRAEKGNGEEVPTTDEVYQIMVDADNKERRESARDFHIERIADSIIRNSVREPIVLYYRDSRIELWDGNRRFYGTKHIMKDDRAGYVDARDRVQWLPAYVYTASGDQEHDELVKHDILVECNFVEPEQISWPAYVKAEQIYNQYLRRMVPDPDDPVLSREVKAELAREYGLKGWRVADRWIKMCRLALEFKEYQEEEQERDPTVTDLLVQERFEYFDELSKPGVYGSINKDPDARDEVFDWMWDGKFRAWTDVRSVPKILADKVAHAQANDPDQDAVKRAIATVIANDPTRNKDKTAANDRIRQFSTWLDSFKREEYKDLDGEALVSLHSIIRDVVKITEALAGDDETPDQETAPVLSA